MHVGSSGTRSFDILFLESCIIVQVPAPPVGPARSRPGFHLRPGPNVHPNSAKALSFNIPWRKFPILASQPASTLYSRIHSSRVPNFQHRSHLSSGPLSSLYCVIGNLSPRLPHLKPNLQPSPSHHRTFSHRSACSRHPRSRNTPHFAPPTRSNNNVSIPSARAAG